MNRALAFKPSAYANLNFGVCGLKTIKDVDNFCALSQRVKEQVLQGGKMVSHTQYRLGKMNGDSADEQPVQVIGNALITDFFRVKPSSTDS